MGSEYAIRTAAILKALTEQLNYTKTLVRWLTAQIKQDNIRG
jgi:hypothetical protein